MSDLSDLVLFRDVFKLFHTWFSLYFMVTELQVQCLIKRGVKYLEIASRVKLIVCTIRFDNWRFVGSFLQWLILMDWVFIEWLNSEHITVLAEHFVPI